MKKAFWIILIVVLLFGMGTRLSFLHKRLDVLNASSLSEVPDPRQMLTEDARLFDALLNAGLVTRTGDGRLKPAPADLILIKNVPVYGLHENGQLKHTLKPGSAEEMILESGEYLLIGCYLMRFEN